MSFGRQTATFCTRKGSYGRCVLGHVAQAGNRWKGRCCLQNSWKRGARENERGRER